jgi:hypothetical protein
MNIMRDLKEAENLKSRMNFFSAKFICQFVFNVQNMPSLGIEFIFFVRALQKTQI